MFASKIIMRHFQILVLNIIIVMYFDIIIKDSGVSGQRLQSGGKGVAVLPPGDPRYSVNTSNKIEFNVVTGALFEQYPKDLRPAFELATSKFIAIREKTKLDFHLLVHFINTADVFKLSRLICNQIQQNMISLLGVIPTESFKSISSYLGHFRIPAVLSWFPEQEYPAPETATLAVSVQPDVDRAVIDVIKHYGWSHIIFLYDSDDGLKFMAKLYENMKESKAKFRITYSQRVNSAEELITSLIYIEEESFFTNKYIVLDCESELAKETLIQHVHTMQLGRRNYHYLLTGFVMDNLMDEKILELGAVNVTGFSLVDQSRKIVKDFMSAWPSKMITVKAAILYDMVHVYMGSVIRLLSRDPDFMRAARIGTGNANSAFNCSPDYDITPYEFGEKIDRVIKRTAMEGLTGNIRFNEHGRRRNFTLQVMMLNATRHMTKIGTWHDGRGFRPAKGRKKLGEQFEFEYNRTFTVLTIEEYPYVRKKKISDKEDHFEGFCIDVTRLLLEALYINYEIKLVNDKKYGNENEKDEWDGLIGEILSKNADMVIAPMIANSQRGKVVDFSKPFLSFDTKLKTKPPADNYKIFSFLMPFSAVVWYCIIGSIIAVSLIIHLVSNLITPKINAKSRTEPHNNVDIEMGTTNTIAVENVVNEGERRLSLWNSIWFTLGSFLHHNTGFTPRSASLRLLTSVWYYFTTILIVIYLANMCSLLVISRINQPQQSYTRVTKCPLDQRKARPPLINGEDDDHPKLGYVPSNGYDNEEPCELIISFNYSGVKNFAVAFPKGSKLRDGVNQALEVLQKDGKLQELIDIWLIETECATFEMEGKELGLDEMAGLFYLLVVVLGASVLIGVMEFFMKKRAMRGRENAQRENGNRPYGEENEDATSQRRVDPEPLEWNNGAYSGYYASEGSGADEEAAPPASFALD